MNLFEAIRKYTQHLLFKEKKVYIISQFDLLCHSIYFYDKRLTYLGNVYVTMFYL